MRRISVALFVEVLAVLTTGYLVTVGFFFLGYFAALNFRFMGLFSVFDFTSQAMIVAPFAFVALAIGPLVVKQLQKVAQRFKVPFREALTAAFIGVVIVPLAIWEWVSEPDATSFEYTMLMVAILLALMGGQTAFELQDELAKPEIDRMEVAGSAAWLVGTIAGGLALIGAVWANFDLQRRGEVAFKPRDKPCFAAAILKSSQTGVLIVRHDRQPAPAPSSAVAPAPQGSADDLVTRNVEELLKDTFESYNRKPPDPSKPLLEFHPFEATESMRGGGCE